MTTPHTEAMLLDNLQLSVSTALTRLGTVHPFVRALTDSRQEPYVSYLNPEQIAEQNHAHRWDRFALRLAQAAGEPIPAGRVTPAPGNLDAISVEAEIAFTLHHVIRRMRRHLVNSHPHYTLVTHADGLLEQITTPACWTIEQGPLCRTCTALEITTPAEPTLEQLLATAREISWAITVLAQLSEVLRDLEAVHTTALDLVDGNARVRLVDTFPGVVCPHCKRPTLAAFFRDDVIRCDRDPLTGTWEECVCPDPFCECKNRPVEFRHDWLRSKPGRDKRSWHALADTFPPSLKARLA